MRESLIFCFDLDIAHDHAGANAGVINHVAPLSFVWQPAQTTAPRQIIGVSRLPMARSQLAHFSIRRPHDLTVADHHVRSRTFSPMGGGQGKEIPSDRQPDLTL
ncbi:MAG TPA: hypothetical protein VHX86_17185 [Tepidisphaeraceae bacterium]|nr:hypothetical protein [Tepidisphaeraceae bacterium]